MKRTRWKAKKYLENLCWKFSFLFGCDRPGSGGNGDVLQYEITSEKKRRYAGNVWVGLHCQWTKKIAHKSFRRLWKEAKTTASRKRPWSTRAQNYLYAQWKRKLSYWSEASLNRIISNFVPIRFTSALCKPSLRFCRTWTKRYLITSQTRVKLVSRIHHRTISNTHESRLRGGWRPVLTALSISSFLLCFFFIYFSKQLTKISIWKTTLPIT